MIFKEQIFEVVKLLQESRRPVFIWGAGIRPHAASAMELARSLGVPVACTWGAIDLIHHDDPLMAGGFGTHGTRAANFAVQNSDLVISIGSRLDTKSTGFPAHFARDAKLVMVDIDQAEISKFDKLGRTIDIGICADAGEFIKAVLADGDYITRPEAIARYAWVHKIQNWRKRYDTPTITWPGINPYELVKEIGKYTTKNDILCSDTGTALGYLMQAFPFKGERFLHAFNMTPMGYGLPAAIGAGFAQYGKRIVLVTGDGSLMMSLSELATVARWQLNIKIILLNNGGHAMCRQTERQWFGGKHVSTDVESGLGFPDFETCARSFDIESRAMGENFLSSYLTWLLAGDDLPRFLDIPIHPDAYLIPQARFGAPIEDQEPMLDREEFKSQMIVGTI
jgi:acetolactate synthase I/II/III large subunit